MRVDSRLNVNTPGTTTQLGSSQAAQVERPLQQRIQDNLFGHRPPLFDLSTASEEQQERLAAILERLRGFRAKLDVRAGDQPGAPIVLASGTIAAIDGDGTIYYDASFLLEHAEETDLLVGILAHEVGHRPRQWARARRNLQGLAASALDDICRYEEIRADTFAGLAMAELGMSVEPMIELLLRVQVEPHPRYLSAEQRGEVLRREHLRGTQRALDMRRNYPDMHRGTAIRDLIGVF